MQSLFRSIKHRFPKEIEPDSFTTNHRQSTLRILTRSPELTAVGNLTVSLPPHPTYPARLIPTKSLNPKKWCATAQLLISQILNTPLTFTLDEWPSSGRIPALIDSKRKLVKHLNRLRAPSHIRKLFDDSGKVARFS